MTDKLPLATVPFPESSLAIVPRVVSEHPEDPAPVPNSDGARSEHTRGPASPPMVKLVKGAEAEEVADLLLHKLTHYRPEDDETVVDTLDVRRAFLRYRFTDPVIGYEKGCRLYSQLDTVLNLASIAAGIGASLLAASGSPKGWTIILGVAIAACQTFSQWLKPSKRAARRARAASELRNEAWNILQGRDRYRGKDLDLAWDIFCNQVDKIADREQTVEDTESAGLPSTGLGNSGGPQPNHR
jgi:hypothetical protein